MAGTGRTFSESWHRIADQKISLRSTVRVRRQLFRGEKWYVLQDPFNNHFFRVRPEAYAFLARLHPDRTIEQVWEECLQRQPDEAPGQEDVIRLLAQLYFANLLYTELPPDSTKLFERYNRRKQRAIQSRLLSIMFMRLPLIDPENLLKRLLPLLRPFLSPKGAVIWLACVLFALKVLAENFEAVTVEAHGILAPANLIFLYGGLVLIKTVHEFGHALLCKRFGGEVHTMGVMLLIFTPLPYMDATASWSFRSRWERALVGAGGLLFELFFAALAVLVWAKTGPGVVHSLAYNMMFIASVSTVLFNANPLLRYDGYYILSDLLDIPNLHGRSLTHLRHLVEHHAFGCRDSLSPAQTLREAQWLSAFGILSGIYRLFVYAAITLFVADRFLLAGLLMALFCVVSWGVVPTGRLVSYLTSSPRLARTRPRALAVSLAVAGVLLFVVALCPFPNRFRAPGVLEAAAFIRVVNDAPGYIKTVLVPTGSRVAAGTPLVKLSDEELDLEIAATRAQREETLALRMRAVYEATAELEPIDNRLAMIERKLKNLQEQHDALVVRARGSGKWVCPRDSELAGSWISRGTELGTLVNEDTFRFSAVVPQGEASRLFAGDIRAAQVRLAGESETGVAVGDYTFIPFQHDQLPSAALGWHAGGDVAVSLKDETGRKAVEPFFQIYATLHRRPEVAFLHGRSGQIQFLLHPEPLLYQWARKFRQLLQKRYRI